jgi:hypothetical protein
MAREAVTLHLPDGLTQDLKSANEGFLVEVIERGLQAVKVDGIADMAIVTDIGSLITCSDDRRHASQRDVT